MTERENQCKQILSFISEGKSITQQVAVKEFGCYRLGARVWDLRNAGFPIGDEWEYQTDNKGKVLKKWKRYYLKGARK